MNKTIQRFFCLALALTLLLSACGGTASSAAPASAAAPASSEAPVSSEAPAEPAKPSTITLTDNAGRTVELPYPVETAVVANRYNSELIRACGAIDKVISVDTNTAQDRVYWGMFDPENVIGKSQTALDYEKIAELAPQVLILPANGSVDEAEKTLAPFGIKVFVISGYDTLDFKNQCENIGKMFNVEESAQKFYNYFNDIEEYIAKQLEGQPKRRVYLESTTDYSTIAPGNAMYGMSEVSGIYNIFSENIETVKTSEVDPEEVIAREPDCIVKLITPAQALSGTGLYEPPEKQQFIDTVAEIKARPGWDATPAVKNDEIYIMTQFSHGGASKLVGSAYIAKWVYPDLLPDLDPHEVFRAWMEDFQGFQNIEGHFYSAAELAA